MVSLGPARKVSPRFWSGDSYGVVQTSPRDQSILQSLLSLPSRSFSVNVLSAMDPKSTIVGFSYSTSAPFILGPQ